MQFLIFWNKQKVKVKKKKKQVPFDRQLFFITACKNLEERYENTCD